MHHSGKRCVAIGFFDGVHLGHRAILQGADEVITFSRHPLGLVRPADEPVLLMTLQERIAAISQVSKSAKVTLLDFDEKISQMTADEFASTYLDGAVIRCGLDWRFGKGAEGSADFLEKRGFVVERVDDALVDGEKVSSSRIRRVLSEGKVQEASKMLVSQYSVTADVIKGKGKGRDLGFATVNLKVRKLPIKKGVYEVFADGRVAIANYGMAPTMGNEAWQEPTLEVHFLSGGGVAAEKLEVEFIRFIREEQSFASVEELARQVKDDCKNLVSSLPKLSVVVTTRNEEENIAQALEAFKSFGDLIETIVVDNSSTDKTKEIASLLGARVFDKGPERSAQRNLGWQKSRADWVMVLDADMIVPNSTTEEVLAKISSGNPADAYWVPEVRTGGTWRVKVRNFERSFYNGTCVDALRLFSKKALIATGGYDEALLAGPEDWDLDLTFLKLGFKAKVLDGFLYHNEKNLTFAKMLAKKAYYTKSFAPYKAKWQGHKSVKKQFSPLYRFFGVFLENGKWRKVLTHPVLFAGVIFERLSVGAIYLKSLFVRKSQD